MLEEDTEVKTKDREQRLGAWLLKELSVWWEIQTCTPSCNPDSCEPLLNCHKPTRAPDAAQRARLCQHASGALPLFQETVDMLKSHIKEELMQGEEADSVYESMAHLSTDLLMKCSLNPGCDEELYESMAAFVPAATEDLCK